MSRRPWLEVAGVLLGVTAFVALTGAVTGETAPIWDGRRYYEMSQRGFDGPLTAPFAYRPALPFLARWLSLAAHLPTELSLRILGRAAAGLALILVYVGARGFGRARPPLAAFLTLCTALSYYHVRFPLFFWSMVDVAAYPLMLLAFHWIWRGKIGRAGLLSVVGLLFKEFLLVPWLVSTVQGYLVAWRRRSARRAVQTSVLLGLGTAALLVPRLGLEVDRSRQWIDPISDPEALRKLVEVSTDPAHLLAVLVAWVAYWMPTLMLATPARVRSMSAAVAPYRRALLLYLLLLTPLVLFGGKNVDIFASYAVAAQLPVLAGMLSSSADRLRASEALLVVACLLFTHHWFEAIPSPITEREAYLAFHGFGSSGDSAARLVALGAWIAGAIVVRLAAGRHTRRARLS